MKILRYVMMAVLALGISGIAHAAGAGFSWNLQDPPSSFPTVLPGEPFQLIFDTCNRPVNGIDYLGCANIGNGSTTENLTSFEFTFENSPALGGAAPSCVSDSFAVLTCNLVGNEYILAFNCDPSDPSCGIAPGHSVTVLESAVDGADFPVVNGVANFTPEPSSIWLALSGMGSMGYLVRRRRRSSSR
jgi:hypothetical protein